MKLLKAVVFGTDMFDGLAWFVLITLACWLESLPIPHGHERLIAVAITSFAAILPDFDMVPYMLIQKKKIKFLLLLGIAGFLVCIAVYLWFGMQSFLWLGFAGLFGTLTAIVVQQKVKDRASHWPIWHYPIPVIVICFGLVFEFASDFAPQHVLYYEILVIPLLVVHFLHDGLQSQGFPYLAPFTDTHYQWKVLGFDKVSDSIVLEHYQQQAARARSHTLKEDAEGRADKITSIRIMLLFLMGITVLATLFFL